LHINIIAGVRSQLFKQHTMNKIYIVPIIMLCVCLVSLSLPGLSQNTIDIQAKMDNTLYESAGGNISNGAGVHIFAGKTNKGSIRRALIAFDIEGNIPTGSSIESVTLTLNMSKSTAGITPVSLHSLTSEWGEGTSDAASNEGGGASATDDDATWIFSFYNIVSWMNIGGDFNSSQSATTDVGGLGKYTWGSTAGMVSDVQKWLDNPKENYGWILLGEETTIRTTKRFDSRENSVELNRPVLTVTYSTPSGIEEGNQHPGSFRNVSNFPNPFSDFTTIEYYLSENSDVKVTIRNILGQEIITLHDGFQYAGYRVISWDGQNSSGKFVKNGVYYADLTSGDQHVILKIMKTK